MIRPNKHAHPDKTLVSATSVLLKRLRNRRIESFDNLRDFLTNRDVELASLFLPAVNLLFILGLLEYRKQNDSFEYVGD